MVAGYKTHVENLRWWLGIYMLILNISLVSGYRYHQEVGGNPARSDCHLATPGVMYFMDQEDVRVTADSSLLKDGEKAWVGYGLKVVYLQYIGCIYIDDVKDNMTYTETPAALDLGICYRICYNSEKPVLGMLGSGRQPCKCFGEEIKQFNLTSLGCTKPCRNDQFICGGYSAVSLYEEVTVDTVNASVIYDGDDRCLSVYGTEYSWDDCNMYYRPVCNKGSRKTIKKGLGSKPWPGSVKQCFERGWYPAVYNKDIQVGPETFWTGVVQTRSLIQFSKWPPSSSDVMLGYANKVGDKHILRFSYDRNSLNKSICHEDFPKTTVKPVISTEVSMNKTGYNGDSLLTTQIGVLNIPNNADVITSTQPDTKRALVKTTPGSNKSNIHRKPPVHNKNLVAVFVLVPVVLAVIAGLLVTTCILIRNRRRNRNTSLVHSQKLLGDEQVAFNRNECVSITEVNSQSEMAKGSDDDDMGEGLK